MWTICYCLTIERKRELRINLWACSKEWHSQVQGKSSCWNRSVLSEFVWGLRGGEVRPNKVKALYWFFHILNAFKSESGFQFQSPQRFLVPCGKKTNPWPDCLVHDTAERSVQKEEGPLDHLCYLWGCLLVETRKSYGNKVRWGKMEAEKGNKKLQ